MRSINRRAFLRLIASASGVGLTAGMIGCGQSNQSAAPAALEQLIIKGPPAPPTIPLAHLATQERLTALVPKVEFSTWANPDQLRADVTSGNLHVAATPTNVAATLHRRGMPVRLLNVTMWGILHLLTVEPSITGWGDLKNQTIAVPFKGDMPDLVFSYLARENGLRTDQDITLQYTASPVEAMQLLLAGQVTTALLGEPGATGAQLQGQQQGLEVRRVLNMQEEWGKATGRAPRIPQAGALATAALIDNHAEVVRAVQEGLRASIAWVNQNPKEAATLGEQYLGGLKAPVIEQALPRSALEFVPAAEAREDLEFFFGKLKDLSPDAIGGDLPDDGFYATI